MEKSLVVETSDESEPAGEEKRYGYALELPYSKQNYNFKSRVTRLGRDLVIIGLVVCLLRSGYVSECIARYVAQSKEMKTQRSWFNGWFTRAPREDTGTLYRRFKSTLRFIPQRWPVFGRVLDVCSLAVNVFKNYAHSAIGWLVIVEDNLPDVGSSLLAIGLFLFFMGSTLILRDNWASFNTVSSCPQCVTDSKRWTLTDDKGNDEPAVRDVELAVPIFKFVKVFPYHKRFSGTTDFSLNSVKMRLIIQFNKATQTP